MPGVLDTFYILFESDSSDVKKGAEDAQRSVDDLEDSLQASDEQAFDLGNSLKTAAIAMAALFAASAAKEGIISTAREADELLKFSQRLNENVSEVDAWGGAAVRAGGSAEGFRSSIESLNEKIVDTAVKGTGELLPFFNQMGISIVDVNGRARSTLDILPELAGAFQGLSRQESAGIGRKLGLDEGTILLLQSGNAEIDKLVKRQKLLGVTTKEQAEISAKFNDLLADTSQAFDAIGRILVVEALPFINDFLELVTDVVIFLRENKTFAASFFGAMAAIIVGAYLPAIISAAAATLVAISPFLAIAAAITAVSATIALIIDDFAAFEKGQDSLIGEALNKWPLLKTVVDGYANSIKALIDLFNKLFEYDLDDFFSVDPKTQELIDKGRTFLFGASSADINGATSSSIANSQTSNTTVAVTGDIIVTPGSGESTAVAQETGAAIKDAVRRAVDTFDDGLVA